MQKRDTIEHRLSYMMNGVNVDTITAHGDAFTKMSTTIDCFKNRNVGKVIVAVLAILCMSSIPFLAAPVYGRSIVAINANGLASVIVGFAPTATTEEKEGLMANIGAVVTRHFTIINGVEATIPVSAIQGLKRNPLVVAVDLNRQSHLLSTAADIQIHADQAWAAGFTGTGVKIAILDTGIDQTHLDLQGRIVACHSEIAGVDCNPNPLPNGAHGTIVAGMALGTGLDPRDKGVAPAGSIMSDKVFDPATGNATDGAIIAGIGWAVDNGARVINMSFGRTAVNDTQANCDVGDNANYVNAVNNAVSRGVTLVAAAGNSPPDPQGIVNLPACYSKVIAVGGVDSTNHWWNGADSGPALADHGVAAPAFNLTSTYPGNQTVTGISGTSLAAPMVSGEIALAYQKYPSLSPAQIRQLVGNSAYCVQTPCPNNNIGYGVVNAYTAFSGGFSMSTNPTHEDFGYCTNYGCDRCGGCFWVAGTLTINSINGFAGTVRLNYVNPGSAWVSGPSSVYVPTSGASVTIYINSGDITGAWTSTIQGSMQPLFSYNVNIPISETHCSYPNCPQTPAPMGNVLLQTVASDSKTG